MNAITRAELEIAQQLFVKPGSATSLGREDVLTYPYTKSDDRLQYSDTMRGANHVLHDHRIADTVPQQFVCEAIANRKNKNFFWIGFTGWPCHIVDRVEFVDNADYQHMKCNFVFFAEAALPRNFTNQENDCFVYGARQRDSRYLDIPLTELVEAHKNLDNGTTRTFLSLRFRKMWIQLREGIREAHPQVQPPVDREINFFEGSTYGRVPNVFSEGQMVVLTDLAISLKVNPPMALPSLPIY